MTQHSKNKRPIILFLTPGGEQLAHRLAQGIDGKVCSAKGAFQETLHQAWHEARSIICIMATGIVVRGLAPLLHDKRSDPAVVVCDEKGRFAIPLVSGHLGGANALAKELAALTGGQAVITTASDVLGLPAPDLWCKKNGLVVADKKAFTRMTGQFVAKGKLSLYIDRIHQMDDVGKKAKKGKISPLPKKFRLVDLPKQANLIISHRAKVPPIWSGAIVHPPRLLLGIGCKRGTSEADIQAAVDTACEENNLAFASIAGLASVDLKSDEPGLLAFAASHKLPLYFFAKEQLNSLTDLKASSVVMEKIGARGVAEPAALLAAQKMNSQARLLVHKQKWTAITTAFAVIPLTLNSL